jgi:ABC-type multidrug transport system fused ATPase/permease subunit
MLKQLLNLLTSHERKRAGLILGMVMVMAIVDMIGTASILPFVAVLSSPELLESNEYISRAFVFSKSLGVQSTQQFMLVLGVFFFILLMISLGFKALTIYFQLRFTYMCEYTIGKRLIEGYLHQPYVWFLDRNSENVGKIILSDVTTVINNALLPVMNLITQGVLAVSLLLLLLFVDAQLALSIVLTVTVAYFLISKATSSLLARIGDERAQANRERFFAVGESFGAFKEIKLLGLELRYIMSFSIPAQIYAQHQATAQVISRLPRFALEAIAFGGMLLLMLYLMAQGGEFASALPTIALYALVGYRLMPALQQIISSVTLMRFARSTLDEMHADLITLQHVEEKTNQDVLQCKQAITLATVNYHYPNVSHSALKNVSISIPAKSTVAFVGKTGSGKTTVVDLILGLLEAQQGTLEVDGQVITRHNRRAWQSAIGYVPQQIYLADDSIAANIAFGVDPEKIDFLAVERASKIANLHEFVINELTNQYYTTVGERGVRLSGGQRQRIGIARAIYLNPKVLILDEATSALDNITERVVMEAINSLNNDITVILVAHRLSTVRYCDQIYLLDQGEVKACGTYEELMADCDYFKALAKTQF